MVKDLNDIAVIAEKAKAEESKPKQKKSVSYALKAISSHLDTLDNTEYIATENLLKMKKWVQDGKARYVKEQYGIE